MKKLGIILFFLLLALIELASAQGVSVQPNAVVHTAQPGELVTQQLRLDNPGSGDLQITVYPGDWQHDNIGEVVYFPTGTLERSASNWITFDRATFPLDQRSTATLNYTVSVPADTAPGSYWAALFVEGTDPAAPGGLTLTNVRLRTAHILYVNVPPMVPSGRISGIFGQAPVSEQAPYTMQLTYLNEGNSMQVLTGEVQIRSVSGELIETVDLGREVALPGVTRTFPISLYGPVPAGDYLALAILNYGDMDTDVAGEFVFSLPHALAPATFQFEEAAERAGQPQSSQEQTP